MTPEQQGQEMGRRVSTDLVAKFLVGAAEHGGVLARKPRLVGEAKKEAIDLCVYLYTAEDQLEQARTLLSRAIGQGDWGLATQAFNVLVLGNPEGQLAAGD